ncbi:hypothetical protein ABVT39_001709 [Epinephelus coioides]
MSEQELEKLRPVAQQAPWLHWEESEGVRKRGESVPDHMCSGAGVDLDPEGEPGPCDVLLLGTPGFPADRGTAEPTRQCHSGSIPQGQSSCFEREMKMAPVIGPLVTSHHTTGERGDLFGSGFQQLLL